MITSWVERKVAREMAAKAFLIGRGFAVNRVDQNGLIARYWVSGWRGDISGKQLIEIAQHHGFDPLATDPAPIAAAAPEPVAIPETVPAVPAITAEEEIEMGDGRAITFTARGDVLREIETRAAEQDLPLGRVALMLVERALEAPTEDAVVAAPVQAVREPDGTKADTIVFLGNVPDAWLVEELGRRLSSGVGDDDYGAAIERAEKAEQQLADVRAAVLGAVSA
jgi:hypothetical protein